MWGGGKKEKQGAPLPPYAGDNVYKFIPDHYDTIEEVQTALAQAGLGSTGLIIGIDFTKSNEWTGKNTFGGRCLHSFGGGALNPYEMAISIMGETLQKFDDDQLIPAYGFGDYVTRDSRVFAFNEGDRPCRGFAELLDRYRQITPCVRLQGPTSFAPIIESAIRLVELKGGQYHILIIIADGQVTRGQDVPYGKNSPQEQATIDAIVAASAYPLSIVMVGVGDGPWDDMKSFDDRIPKRNFDNFQFVNLTNVFYSGGSDEKKRAKFAVQALMEIPLQYKACQYYQLIGRQVGKMPPYPPLDPPPTAPR